MHIRIGLVTGEIVVGDNISESEIQDMLDESDGRIGEGFMSNVVCETVDDFVAFLERTLVNVWPAGGDSTSITVPYLGEQRKIDFDDIAWARVIRD